MSSNSSSVPHQHADMYEKTLLHHKRIVEESAHPRCRPSVSQTHLGTARDWRDCGLAVGDSVAALEVFTLRGEEVFLHSDFYPQVSFSSRSVVDH